MEDDNIKKVLMYQARNGSLHNHVQGAQKANVEWEFTQWYVEGSIHALFCAEGGKVNPRDLITWLKENHKEVIDLYKTI